MDLLRELRELPEQLEGRLRVLCLLDAAAHLLEPGQEVFGPREGLLRAPAARPRAAPRRTPRAARPSAAHLRRHAALRTRSSRKLVEYLPLTNSSLRRTSSANSRVVATPSSSSSERARMPRATAAGRSVSQTTSLARSES